VTIVDAIRQRIPEWPGFRPQEWLRRRRAAASAEDRVPIRDWVDAGRPARIMGVDTTLIWVCVALLALGLVMVYSASVALPDSPRFALYSSTHFLSRQAVSIAIA
jgi:cell division protein FtsW